MGFVFFTPKKQSTQFLHDFTSWQLWWSMITSAMFHVTWENALLKYKFDFENETLTSMIIKMVIKLRFQIVSESIKIIYNIFIKLLKDQKHVDGIWLCTYQCVIDLVVCNTFLHIYYFWTNLMSLEGQVSCLFIFTDKLSKISWYII